MKQFEFRVCVCVLRVLVFMCICCSFIVYFRFVSHLSFERFWPNSQFQRFFFCFDCGHFSFDFCTFKNFILLKALNFGDALYTPSVQMKRLFQFSLLNFVSFIRWWMNVAASIHTAECTVFVFSLSILVSLVLNVARLFSSAILYFIEFTGDDKRNGWQNEKKKKNTNDTYINLKTNNRE